MTDLERRVLGSVAIAVLNNGAGCGWSKAKLGRMAGCSPRTVGRALRKAEERKIIRIERTPWYVFKDQWGAPGFGIPIPLM